MSFFTADNVVVGNGGGSSAPSSTRVQQWANNVSYSDGQIVTFNGSQYIASGSPGVGLIPAIEAATPQVPGQPKWLLAARGRSLPVVYDDAITYYADQVVTYLGGTFILDAATVPVGTRPNRDKRWTRLSESLTDAESERVSSSDLSSFANNTTSAIFATSDETPRVSHHWVRASISSVMGAGTLYVMKFPRPIQSQARPFIDVQFTDMGSALMLLAPLATYTGNQVLGYTMNVENAAIPGTYEFLVTVKEAVDQVTVS